jgi:hypothetical protein
MVPKDLTFCYLHMTSKDLQVLDTLGTSDYIKGELSDDGKRAPYSVNLELR